MHRHAIDTAQITAIRERYSKIIDFSTKSIFHVDQPFLMFFRFRIMFCVPRYLPYIINQTVYSYTLKVLILPLPYSFHTAMTKEHNPPAEKAGGQPACNVVRLLFSIHSSYDIMKPACQGHRILCQAVLEQLVNPKPGLR
jgi:hypothetical protein